MSGMQSKFWEDLFRPDFIIGVSGQIARAYKIR